MEHLGISHRRLRCGARLHSAVEDAAIPAFAVRRDQPYDGDAQAGALVDLPRKDLAARGGSLIEGKVGGEDIAGAELLQDTAQVRLASAELVVAGYPDVVVQGVERGDLGRAVINGGGEGAAREVAAVDEEDVAVRRTFAGDVRREASEVKVGVNVRRLDYGQRVGRRDRRERGQECNGQKCLFHG